ncbi:UvrB/UvrC motif-containing protein [Zavarzinella formosa]|uniref:UvrB/UvrC motif-containing protein n=1 Tax=Zavarzinella formosa TaxID=360055 RepID=UPI0002FEFC6B|nr:UvrB/UvrC motif-containing protein [Zavarzinella formosa]
MKCQQCAKTSTMQITEIHGDNDFEEFHLCDDCAQKYLYAVAPKKKKIPEIVDPLTEKHCDQCGTKFIDFRNSGRLGCPHDYDVFLTELIPLLENIHGGLRHTGKTPRSRPTQKLRQQEMARLREDLQTAIHAEAYEDAARLRDRLRELEGD